MKLPSFNPSYRAALILILMAAVLIGTALLTNRGDFTSAMLVVAGIVCLLTGVFFSTLSGSDPVDLRYISLFPVQGSISLTRTCADLGIQGNAHILPGGRDGRDHPMQFMPVTEYHHDTPLLTEPFVTGSDTAGILVPPACAPLADLLKQRDHFTIPADIRSIHLLIRELGVDVLDLATRITSSDEGEVFTVTIEDYRLIDGCRAMARESPRCCAANPCTICSLFAVVIAEGTGRTVRVEQCAPDQKRQNVTAIFSIIHD